MTIHHTAIRAIALALCTFAPACDDPDAVEFRYVPPPNSGYWTDGDDFCEGFYMKTEQGSMCLPPCSDALCGRHQTDECGHVVGNASACIGNSFCAFACLSDTECIPGQRCSTNGVCVWENMTAYPQPAITPGMWGLCGTECDVLGGACTENNVGIICTPTCNVDTDCAGSPSNICSEKSPAVCDAGICKVPCDGNGGCHGLPGMECYAPSQTCVHPI